MFSSGLRALFKHLKTVHGPPVRTITRRDASTIIDPRSVSLKRLRRLQRETRPEVLKQAVETILSTDNFSDAKVQKALREVNTLILEANTARRNIKGWVSTMRDALKPLEESPVSEALLPLVAPRKKYFLLAPKDKLRLYDAYTRIAESSQWSAVLPPWFMSVEQPPLEAENTKQVSSMPDEIYSIDPALFPTLDQQIKRVLSQEIAASRADTTRGNIVHQFASALEKYTNKKYTIVCVGSVATNLSTADSDIDLAIAKIGPPLPPYTGDHHPRIESDMARGVTQHSRGCTLLYPETQEDLDEALQLLFQIRKWKPRRTAVKCLLRKVRVPLAKLQYAGGREIDVSLLHLPTHHNPRLVTAFAAHSPLFLPLVRLVKRWAKRRGLVNAAIHFLNSWTLVLLVAQYMQLRSLLPVVHAACREAETRNPSTRLQRWRRDQPLIRAPETFAELMSPEQMDALKGLIHRIETLRASKGHFNGVTAPVGVSHVASATSKHTTTSKLSSTSTSTSTSTISSSASVSKSAAAAARAQEAEDKQLDDVSEDDAWSDTDVDDNTTTSTTTSPVSLQDASAALSAILTGGEAAVAAVGAKEGVKDAQKEAKRKKCWKRTFAYGVVRVGSCDYPSYRHLPRHLQTALVVEPDKKDEFAPPTPTLADLLSGFFIFYASVFDPVLFCISVRCGRLTWRHEVEHYFRPSNPLLVEEPFDEISNTARSLTQARWDIVQSEMRRAAELLCRGGSLEELMEVRQDQPSKPTFAPEITNTTTISNGTTAAYATDIDRDSDSDTDCDIDFTGPVKTVSTDIHGN